MKCISCDNPHHPATGHAFSATAALCGPCARHFVAWLKDWLKRSKKVPGTKTKVKFYDAAVTSIRAT